MIGKAMKQLFISVALLMLFGCGIGSAKNYSAIKDRLTKTEGYLVFEGTDGLLQQSLYIKFFSKDKIKFYIFTENKEKMKSSEIKGMAINTIYGDPEIDEDEHGEAYFVEEYFFKNNGCLLSIRIDDSKKDKAKILESNCETRHDKAAPYESIGLLRIKQ